jgi:flagellar biosynthetic protein FliR
MPWPLFDILLALPVFALVLFRLSGLVLTAPMLASPVIPVRIRAAVAFTLAAMVFPMVRVQAPANLTLATAVVGGVGEVMIGAAIGLSLSILLLVGEVAGSMIGQQAGLSLGEVIDPLHNEQASVVGQVYTIVLTIVFLLAGGHRAAIAAVLDTFKAIPLLSYNADDSIVVLLVEMLTAAFIVGLRVAGPAMIALFLTAIALAVVSRAMPALNILSVGFTVKVMVAVAVIWLTLGLCQDILVDAVWDGLDTVRAAFGLEPSAAGLIR